MKRVYLLILILVFVIGSFTNCKSSKNKKNVNNRDMIAFSVKTVVVKKEYISEYFEYAGSVESFNKINVLPEITGRIKKMYKNIGETVKKGNLLFELEDTLYKAQYEQAKAGLSVAEVSYKDAEKNMKRISVVYKKNGVSKTQYEQAISGYKLAKSNYERAKAVFDIAEYQYNSTRVKSPFSGVITGKYKEEGDFINPSMGGFSPSTGVYTLEDYSKIYVDIDIPLSESVLIKKSMKAEIVHSGFSIPAKVLTINEKTDPMTSSVSARIIAKNMNKSVLPGTIVKVRIHYKEKQNALVIPFKSVLDGNRVFVVEGNHAKERYVKLGLKNPEYVEILEGVRQGEKVIVEGNFGLFNNAIIEEVK